MKRHPSLVGLSDDHHTALVIALRCKRAREDGLAGLWEAVRAAGAEHFEPHFQIEETHLLPALVALGEDAMAARIREDHAALRDGLAQPRPTLDAVRDFGRRLDEHVRLEERQVFEKTQRRLPAAALRAIDAACREMPRSCPSALLRAETA